MGSRHTGTTVRSRGAQVGPLSSETATPRPATSETATTETAAPRARRSVVGRRRPAALLAALVVGGMAAAVVGTQALPSADAGEPLSVTELLGSDAEGMLEPEMSPQEAITEVEAKARLDEVAASRAQRAAEAEAAEAAAQAAAEDGVVLRAGAATGFGYAVYILGVSGDVTVYGHMEKILVDAGDVVEAGDTIALEGSRGQSTGPHLHFEVHSGGMDGKRVDPVAWLRARGVDV